MDFNKKIKSLQEKCFKEKAENIPNNPDNKLNIKSDVNPQYLSVNTNESDFINHYLKIDSSNKTSIINFFERITFLEKNILKYFFLNENKNIVNNIDFEEFKKAVKLDNLKFNEIKESINNIFNRFLKLKNHNNVNKLRVIDFFSFNDREKEITIVFSHFFYSYLLEESDLKEYFLYNVIDNELSSKYSLMFYKEILKNYSFPLDKGMIEYSIEDFRKVFCIPKSYSIGMIKKQIIPHVTKELISKKNIVIDVEFIKSGKRIIEIKIFFLRENK